MEKSAGAKVGEKIEWRGDIPLPAKVLQGWEQVLLFGVLVQVREMVWKHRKQRWRKSQRTDEK